MLRLYHIRHSTDVERVALALAHKGLRTESIWVPSGDRSEVRRVSGQDLVPVLWFNRVWKRPPNEIAAELEKPEGERDLRRVERLGRAMQGHLDLFERMLAGRDYLQVLIRYQQPGGWAPRDKGGLPVPYSLRRRSSRHAFYRFRGRGAHLR